MPVVVMMVIVPAMPILPSVIHVVAPIAITRQVGGPMGEAIPHSIPPVADARPISHARQLRRPVPQTRSITYAG